MANKNLTNFLLYSYFGFESEDVLNNSITAVKKCAHRAYLDLARTIDYKYSSSTLDNMPDKEFAKSFREAKDKLIKSICEEQITKSIVDYNKNDFEDWHNGLCNNIQTKMNSAKNSDGCIVKDKKFTYGQAQKWLNMTLKYCWLLGKLGNIDVTSLHVPIDGYIIEAVQSKEDYGLGIADYKVTSWSSWNDKAEYKKLQEMIKNSPKIKKYKSSIEWESKAWIEVAKKHATQRD